MMSSRETGQKKGITVERGETEDVEVVRDRLIWVATLPLWAM